MWTPSGICFLPKGPLDVLDHAAPTPIFGSKTGVDATRKLPAEGHSRSWPEEIVMDEATRELVTRRWKDYGLG